MSRVSKVINLFLRYTLWEYKLKQNHIDALDTRYQDARAHTLDDHYSTSELKELKISTRIVIS